MNGFKKMLLYFGVCGQEFYDKREMTASQHLYTQGRLAFGSHIYTTYCIIKQYTIRQQKTCITGKTLEKSSEKKQQN